MIKKFVLFMSVCFIVFWSCRIYSINKIEERVCVYDSGETFDYYGITISAVESQIYTYNEASDKFGLGENDLSLYGYEKDSKVICVCFNIKNDTDNDISWDEIMDSTMGGFETSVWACAVGSFPPEINIFYDISLKSGCSADIWQIAPVNKVCFKDKNWNNLQKYEFYYVLSLSPQKIKIKLDI